MNKSLLIICLLAALAAGCERVPDAASRAGPRQAVPAAAAAPSSPAPTPPPAVRPEDRKVLHLSGTGLDLRAEAGGIRALRFEMPVASVIAAISRPEWGGPQRERNEECGAGPLDMTMWPSGFTLVSRDGRFLGWSLVAVAGRSSPDGLRTATGLGLGTTRKELESVHGATVLESTLGWEFTAGDLFGVLDGKGPNARVTALWGGTSCNFR